MEHRPAASTSSTKLTAAARHDQTSTGPISQPERLIELPEKILRRIRLNKNFVNVYTPFHDLDDEDYQITVSTLIQNQEEAFLILQFELMAFPLIQVIFTFVLMLTIMFVFSFYRRRK